MQPHPETEFLSTTGRIHHDLNWKTLFYTTKKTTYCYSQACFSFQTLLNTIIFPLHLNSGIQCREGARQLRRAAEHIAGRVFE